MYEMMEMVFGLLALGLGIYMAVAPKSATKKEMRDDPAAVAKTRKSGIIVTIVCISVFYACPSNHSPLYWRGAGGEAS